MQIRVTRQACCAADDQSNPLQAVYTVDDHTTIADLAERIQASKFLQFSSTHNRLSGEVDGVCVVEVFAGWFKGPTFHVSPATAVAGLIGPRVLDFSFRHVR
jgi:hypothetical protein